MESSRKTLEELENRLNEETKRLNEEKAKYAKANPGSAPVNWLVKIEFPT